MKKLLLATVAIFLLSYGNSFATLRMPLGEMFTNTGCGPCYNAEIALDNIMEEHWDDYSLIRYHVSWPSSGDPFYTFNRAENMDRNDYYNNDYTPHLFIDGIVDGEYYYNNWDDQFALRWDTPSPLEIELIGHYNGADRENQLHISMTATDNINFNDLRLFCVLIENYIQYNAPNGVRQHDQTMRDIVPDSDGESFTISNGETKEFDFTIALDPQLAEDNCEIVVFVQDYSTKEVLQSAKIDATSGQTGIDNDGNALTPKTTILSQNYPNPFNAETSIAFSLDKTSFVNLSVYNLKGQKVAELANGNYKAGLYSVSWDASEQASGVYFYRLSANGEVRTRRMALIK